MGATGMKKENSQHTPPTRITLLQREENRTIQGPSHQHLTIEGEAFEEESCYSDN